jgi:DNA-binding transcriptional regulator YiaG
MDAEAFKRHRRRLRLTQAALAAKLGVHTLTVSRWETGAHPIPQMVALLITSWKGKGGRPKKRGKR